MRKYTKFSKWINKFDTNKILNLIKEGKNIKEISKIVEIPERRLGEMIKFYNLPNYCFGQKIPKNNNFFQNINSEIKAYLLGYTLADGCVTIEPKKKNGIIYSYSKRLSYGVSIDDKEVIELLKDNIAPKAIIKTINNQKGVVKRKLQLSLRFSSSKLVDDLIKLNIKPNKTYDSNFRFDFNNINQSLIRHFIRGFFDGDGGINRTDINFVSTSLLFLNQIETFIKKEIPNITFRYYHNVGKTIDYYKLHFNINKNVKKEIYNLFYDNSNYYLQRKKIKFKI